MLVDAPTPLGTVIEHSLAPPERLDYIKRNAPKEIDLLQLIRTFKKDIFLDVILEVVEDIDVYYIQTSNGRGDELYYFSAGGKIFHGDKIWSTYHDFFPYLELIKHSAIVDAPCWFVGSRSNYTHQLIDFMPSLIYQLELCKQPLVPPIVNVFGRPNSILDSLQELPLFRQQLRRPKLYLESFGMPTVVGNWIIKCIRFRQLYLVRHISIFKAFSLIIKGLGSSDQQTSLPEISPKKGLLYLARGDKRIVNQDEIISRLSSKYNADIIKDIHELSYDSKSRLISDYRQILLPPGSDNINGLCFSSQSAQLFQMTPLPTSCLLDSPFSSYAGLRYLLPFMHRITFVPSTSLPGRKIFNSGNWDVSKLESLLSNNLSYQPT